MRLGDLLSGAGELDVVLEPPGSEDVEITAVTHDSRKVSPGSLFCCIPGSTVDGHNFAADAADAGASALLVQRAVDTRLPQVLAASVRQALGPLSATFWGNPSHSLTTVGITGTSGKTTTSHLLAGILETQGWSTAVVGTLSGARTTPEAPELQERLAIELTAGRRAAVMEVSSHALAMGRVRSTRFAVSIFTNLSHDHLDFHGDLDAYFETKASLFTPELSSAAVVNLDDERGAELARRALVPTSGFALSDARGLSVGPDRAAFEWRGEHVALPLGGSFNVRNALAAAAAADLLAVPVATIADALSHAAVVPGRFEPVQEGQPFTVLVDYAHKPGALADALAAARSGTDGSVIVVFGAGGDRDPSKRPEMGEVAARLADRVLLTSDNPRGEDPLRIIEAIRSGMPASAPVVVEPDRSAAIARAVAEARPGDVVLIAGKGHETHQESAGRSVPFDDRAEARAALRSLRGSER